MLQYANGDIFSLAMRIVRYSRKKCAERCSRSFDKEKTNSTKRTFIQFEHRRVTEQPMVMMINQTCQNDAG
jgi:hypothetical protein